MRERQEVSGKQSQRDAADVHDRLAGDLHRAQRERRLSLFQVDHAELQWAEFFHLRFGGRTRQCVLVRVEQWIPAGGDSAGEAAVAGVQFDERASVWCGVRTCVFPLWL